MKIRMLSPLLLLATSCALPDAIGLTEPREVAESARLQADVAWLADDAQEGRRAGTEAGRRSGEWIAARMAALGLEPAGEDGGYLQAFDVPLPIRDGGSSSISWLDDDLRESELSGADAIVPLFCSDGATAHGPLVWGGYGIVHEQTGRDELLDPAIRGGVVLVVHGAPPYPVAGEVEHDDTATVQAGVGWGNAVTLFTKVMNAKQRGAAAVVVAEHPASGLEWMRFDVSRSAQANLPAVFVSAAAARELVPNYDDLLSTLEQGGLAAWPSVEVSVRADVQREAGAATNVLGRLSGGAPGATVVIGAHYDHLGHGGDGSLAPDQQGEIHNGADDNASGTAAVLEMARLFVASPPPAGDVVFALWSGEELGLLGSEHWARNATLPLEGVAANLNLDMVGRAGDGVLTVLGAGTAAPFELWLAEAGVAAELELKVNRSGQGMGGSDHQTFLKREIPAVHFFSGVHEDYHKPSDDLERFEAEGTRRVVELGVDLTRRMLAAEELAFVQVADEGEAKRRAGGTSAWFGTVPEYSYEGTGLLLSGTSVGSPAEKAGLLKGDVVLQVGDIQIDNIHDFVHAIQTYKAGDVVLTRYLRGQEERDVRMTLAHRPGE
jgi:hypothetical protein